MLVDAFLIYMYIIILFISMLKCIFNDNPYKVD